MKTKYWKNDSAAADQLFTFEKMTHIAKREILKYRTLHYQPSYLQKFQFYV